MSRSAVHKKSNSNFINSCVMALYYIFPDHKPKIVCDNNLKLHRWIDLIEECTLHKNDNSAFHNFCPLHAFFLDFQLKMYKRYQLEPSSMTAILSWLNVYLLCYCPLIYI